MSFTGKATYTAGSTLPEIAEDISDLVSIVSPHETSLLDALGDPLHSTTSTRHEWLEDELLPNSDEIDQPGLNDGSLSVTALDVVNGSRFRVGDQVRQFTGTEVMLVTAISGNTLTLTRGYGGTAKTQLTDGAAILIVGNAALEGADASAARFNTRTRKSNYTQIFTASVLVSGTEAAVRHVGVDDEIDYQPAIPIHFCSVTTLGEKQALSVPETNAQFCDPFFVQKKLHSTFNCRSNARRDSTSNSIRLCSRFIPAAAKRPSWGLWGLFVASFPAISIVCLAIRHFFGRLPLSLSFSACAIFSILTTFSCSARIAFNFPVTRGIVSLSMRRRFSAAFSTCFRSLASVALSRSISSFTSALLDFVARLFKSSRSTD